MPTTQDGLVESGERFRAAAAAVCDVGGITEPNVARLHWWLSTPAWQLAVEQHHRVSVLVGSQEASDG